MLCALIFLVLSALFSKDQSIRGVSIAFILLLVLPILILVWRDTGSIFRWLGEESSRFRLLGRVLGYPQAAFGFVCALVGLAVIPMVIYNWIVNGKAPQGPWLTAPGGFMLFGIFFMRDAFRAPEKTQTKRQNLMIEVQPNCSKGVKACDAICCSENTEGLSYFLMLKSPPERF